VSKRYVEVLAEDGRAVTFEISTSDAEDSYDGPVPASSLRGGLRRGSQTLAGGIAIARDIAQAITHNLDSLEKPPERVCAEVGLAVTMGADFVITTSTEAHLVITMEWGKAQP
jgi:hypothetical protein